jgi:hypothetical protein
MRLGASPAEVQQMVREKKVSATMAVNEVRKDPAQAPQALRDAIGRAKDEGKDRATVKHTVKPKADPLAAIKKSIKDANLTGDQLTELADFVAEEIGKGE